MWKTKSMCKKNKRKFQYCTFCDMQALPLCLLACQAHQCVQEAGHQLAHLPVHKDDAGQGVLALHLLQHGSSSGVLATPASHKCADIFDGTINRLRDNRPLQAGQSRLMDSGQLSWQAARATQPFRLCFRYRMPKVQLCLRGQNIDSCAWCWL